MPPPDKLLVLDLDETLVYSRRHVLAGMPDFDVEPFHVYKRPHVDYFLATCLQWFRVGVWSSASPDYVAGVVRALFPEPDRLAFAWAADRCTVRYDERLGGYCARKSLKKLLRRGYAREAVIAVDDSPEKWRQSYGNLVQVLPFLGAEKDDELTRLLPYLYSLRDQPDVRAVDKRRWRHQPIF